MRERESSENVPNPLTGWMISGRSRPFMMINMAHPRKAKE